jgi:hypothetical protein
MFDVFFSLFPRIELVNRCDRPSFQIIGQQFPFSQREKAGMRESRPNESLKRFLNDGTNTSGNDTIASLPPQS